MGLRILLASDHYPPFIGGAHRQIYLLGRELTQRGHDVTIATVWHPGLPEQEDDDGVTIYRFKQLRTCLPLLVRNPGQQHQPPYPDPITIAGLRRLIARFQPDLVHSHGWFSYSCAAALLGTDIPLLISARDYGYSCPTRVMLFMNQHLCNGPEPMKCLHCAMRFYGPLKGAVATASVFGSRALLLHKVRGVHSVSTFVKTTLQRDLFSNHSAQLESNGGPILERVISSFLIDSEDEEQDTGFLRRLPEEPYILYVGGLHHRKGLGTLLEAYEQLKSPPPLVLIGYSAPDMPKSFPRNVVVLQDVKHTDVMLAWSHCLFGVMPSVWPDPSPGIVREGMSNGKAIIGTGVGGTPEMILDGKTGLLIPAGDVNALARSMQQLIDNEELRVRLGQAALNQTRQFTADFNVPRFECMYEQIADETRRSSLP